MPPPLSRIASLVIDDPNTRPRVNIPVPGWKVINEPSDEDDISDDGVEDIGGKSLISMIAEEALRGIKC